MKFLLCLMLLTMAATPVAHSQEAEIVEDKFSTSVSPFIKVPLFSFTLSPKPSSDDSDVSEDEVKYSPNAQPSLGARLNYKGFAISISAPMSSDEDELRSKGRTKHSDFDVMYMADKWGIDLGWNRYEGFYEDLLESQGTSDVFTKRADIKKQGRFVNLFFIPFGRKNKDWHFTDSPFEDTKSEDRRFFWTPIVQVSYEEMELTSGSPMIPQEKYALFGEDATLMEADITSYGLAGGAIANYDWEVHKLWIATTIGIARQESKLTYENNTTNTDVGGSGMNISLRSGYEYTWDLWRSGFSLMMDLKEYRLSEAELNTSTGSVLIYGSRALEL